MWSGGARTYPWWRALRLRWWGLERATWCESVWGYSCCVVRCWMVVKGKHAAEGCLTKLEVRGVKGALTIQHAKRGPRTHLRGAAAAPPPPGVGIRRRGFALHACMRAPHSTAQHHTAPHSLLCAHTSISAPICKVVAPIYDPRLSIQPELVYKAHRSRISRQVCEETVRIRDFRASAQTKTCPPRPTPAGSTRVTHVRHMHSQAPGWTDFQRLQLSDRKANILFLVQKICLGAAGLGSDRGQGCEDERAGPSLGPTLSHAPLHSHSYSYSLSHTHHRHRIRTAALPAPLQEGKCDRGISSRVATAFNIRL